MTSTKVEIINYSERAFAVVGEGTKILKDDLKKLGGKYNANLTCGAGWIFSVKSLDSVRSFLDMKKALKIATKDFLECKESSSKPKSKRTKSSSESEEDEPVKPVKPVKVVKKVTLKHSESESEEDEPVKPVKPVKVVKKVTLKDSDSESDSEEDEPVKVSIPEKTSRVSYQEHTRVTQELVSAKEQIKLLEQSLSNLQTRFLECEDSKIIYLKKYKNLKAKVKQSQKECKSVSTTTEFTESESVELPHEQEYEDVPNRHVEGSSIGKICVAM